MSRITAADRLRRVLAIVPYIVANPGRTVAELAERFGVGERALLEDLSVVFMVGLPPYSPDSLIDVEIDADSRVTIRLADYFSRPLRLTPGQGLALVAASDALLSIPGTDPDGSLARALAKLGGVLGVAEKDPVDVHLGAAEAEVLEKLRGAVSAGTEVEIDYYSWGRDAVTHRRVVPWRVFADGGYWYLDGWCHLADGERLFRVDRIDKVLDTGEPARIPVPEDRQERRVFEATDTDARVTLRLQPSAQWVLESYPWEKMVERDDGTIDVTMAVVRLPWLERLLVRLGSAAAVIDHRGLPEAERLASTAAARILSRYR